jgi:molecular chaperone DnaK (HSP70)
LQEIVADRRRVPPGAERREETLQQQVGEEQNAEAREDNFSSGKEQSFRFTHKNFTLHVFSAHVLLDVAASAEAHGGEYQKGIGNSQPIQSSDGQRTLYHHTTSLTT